MHFKILGCIHIVNMQCDRNISQCLVFPGLHSADSLSGEPQTVLSRKRLQELLQEIDPRATLDEDVEDVCLKTHLLSHCLKKLSEICESCFMFFFIVIDLTTNC